MAFYTVVIKANDPRRYVPPSWPLEVSSKDPAVILQIARDMCLRENVTLIRVMANDTRKEVK